MSGAFQIRVYDKQRLAFESDELFGPVELGRQNPGEEGPYALKKEAGRWRLVVAKVDELAVSRKHLLVEPLQDHTFRVTNLRDKLPLSLEGVGELAPKASCECSLPFVLPLGQKAVRFLEKAPSAFELHSLAESARPPGPLTGASSILPLVQTPVAAVDGEAIFQWLRAVMGVLQSAAGSSDFFQQAAKAAVELIGLDSCRVLLLEKDSWKTQVVKTGSTWSAEVSWHASHTVLAKVRQEKKTCWQVPRPSAQDARSLEGVRAVVAAPILNPREEVIGVLYGDRVVGGNSLDKPQIVKLEAMLVELLASGVAAGLARLEQEKATLTARVQFEQFFTPELSRHLTSQPDLLTGKEEEVTVLFCDIRGSSRICERLGPALTGQWISDVLGALSACVQDHHGVLVDYLGDEVEAMWGAPENQPDHAALACRAALAMLEALPQLNVQWQARLQEPLRVGVGIHTGPAFVGNNGSPRKFKYGPLGNSVNLASRVEGASKYLKTRLVITGSTRAKLDSSFAVRRLARVRVVNIAEPVDLYELAPSGQPRWDQLKEGYEKALDAFERQDFRGAVQILGALAVEFPEDGSSRVLLSRALNFLDAEPGGFMPVWDLPGK